jgi:alkaline phosphatase D
MPPILYLFSILLFLLSIFSFQPTSQKNSCDTLTIAFGSCSDQDKPQMLWDEILSEKPDIWIWTGDNIYGDTEDMKVLRKKYKKQKKHPIYQDIVSQTVIEGIWDDHDYGLNDGGKDYTMKKSSQKEFLKFLNVPKDDIRWTREGIYYSFDISQNNVQIKCILLDTRYFRDDPNMQDTTYIPNYTGSILGGEQWKWLENELNNSTAEVNILVSSIQVISDKHIDEKWGNFPSERTRLLTLLAQANVKRPIIISGDRHIGEISKMNWQGKTITEITSSSLTHASRLRVPEENPYRVDSIIYHENYGLLKIPFKKNTSVASWLKGNENTIWAHTTID